MPGLQFLFRDVIDEINALARVASRFVEPGTLPVFPELVRSLQGIQDRRSSSVFRWEISRDRPIRTVPSDGEYNRTNKGKHKAYAQITSVWEVKALVPSKKKWRCERFELAGLASTVITLLDQADTGDPTELGMWRMEIGDDNSPGCHFHVQMSGEGTKAPFPKSMSVPRLPVFPVTPTTALEFVLGELFQARWPEQLSKETDSLRTWRRIQSDRLERFLSWQRDEVMRVGALGAPWPRLKALKPKADLFAPTP